MTFLKKIFFLPFNFYLAKQNNTSNLGFHYEDLVVGNGVDVKLGDEITFDYVGTFLNGSVFDSSIDRKCPLKITLGSGNVIKGLENGIIGMRPGGKRKIIVNPEFAYGKSGYAPVIPPNSILSFTVDLRIIN